MTDDTTTATVETRDRTIETADEFDDLEVTEAVVTVELPPEVIADARDYADDDADLRDELSDRLILRPTVDGEPV